MIHILKMGRSLLIAVALALPTAAAAEPFPKFNEIGTPQEIELVGKAMALAPHDPESGKAALVQLDQILAQLPQAKARGMVQMLRASVLESLDRSSEAQLAAEEGIRLLPNYSAPLLLASRLYSFSDKPGPGADYLIRASRLDPDLVLATDSYEVGNLLNRLRHVRDERRERALSTRLIDLGWKGDNFGTRSALVMDVLQWRLGDGDEKGARELVPSLISPSHMYRLLALNSAKPIWENIELWAGARLEKQWAVYLTETRERWTASQDLDAALEYADALTTAEHHQTILAEMLPLMSRPLDKAQDHQIMFLAAKVAGSLARYGRWGDIEAMYERLMAVWPVGSTPNALNLSGNRARHLWHAGRNDEALRLIDATIADATRRGGEINGDALLTMHQARTCILHEMGRDAEAVLSKSLALANDSPDNMVATYLCLERPDEARRVLIEGLKHERTRDSVIAYVQPEADWPMKSQLGAMMAARYLKLRQDPKLRAAVEKHGRILPFAVSAAAPPEAQRSMP